MEEFRAVILALTDVVEKAGEKTGSAFDGLSVTAIAFAALLDIYAGPNAENPLGMCDDKQAFRLLFADMIVGARPE
jgi:hypothetical protein